MNDQATSVYSRRDYERNYRKDNREKIRENKRRWRKRQKEAQAGQTVDRQDRKEP